MYYELAKTLLHLIYFADYKMKTSFRCTINACFTACIVQAVINNFIPLLFVTFNESFHIPMSQITLLITINFGIQLLVDIFAAFFADKIGYRASMVSAHFFCALGLILLGVLPELTADPFTGILISVLIYAIGGGLLEVLVSPVMESCPTDNKEAAMSLLHSFYCWGHVGVVLVSTVFFALFGIANWKYLAIIWAILPIVNMVIFTKTPMAPLIKDGHKGMSVPQLLKNKIFWILLVLMVCSGASEQIVSQWSSALAEQGLGVSKAIADLAGPMLFAITMGISRAIYGKFGEKLQLQKTIVVCTVLCILSYLIISLSGLPALGLLGCAVCGFSVGIMWPGTFSTAAVTMPLGGTAMFALLALGGDIGCSGGPTFAGLMAGALDNNLKLGILCAIIFPIILLIFMWILKKISISS